MGVCLENLEQRVSVGEGVGGALGGLFIAGEFAVGSDPREDEPKDGIEPVVKQGEGGEEVVECDVAATEVGGFVEEDLTEFVGGERVEEMEGEEEARAEHADEEGGGGESICLEKRNGFIEVEGELGGTKGGEERGVMMRVEWRRIL